MTRRAWILFAAMGVLWGMPYLLIKVAAAELSPFVIVDLRALGAAALLLPIAHHRGLLGSLRGKFRLVAAFAVIEITVPFTLIAYGETHLSSSLAGLLIAAVPLFVAILALRFDAAERVRGARLLGLGVGLGGVVLLLGLEVAGDIALVVGAFAILGAAMCYAGGALLIKRTLADVPPLAMISAGLGLTGMLLAAPALATAPRRGPSGSVILAMMVLTIVCTALAFGVFFALIGAVGSSRATVITYVNPAVAAALGVGILGEPLTGAMGAGFLLIIVGSWMSTGGTFPPRMVSGVRRILSTGSARPAAHEVSEQRC
jgi:drug/metabolite transporter (DMT)-like permease